MTNPADDLAEAAREIVNSTHEERQDVLFLGNLERASKALIRYDATRALREAERKVLRCVEARYVVHEKKHTIETDEAYHTWCDEDFRLEQEIAHAMKLYCEVREKDVKP